MEVDSSDDYDETPQSNEVYQEIDEVELESDAEEDVVEVTALLAVMEEPSCFNEAVTNPEWVQAMDSEMQSICKNGT
jgi:hypothetical protein